MFPLTRPRVPQEGHPELLLSGNLKTCWQGSASLYPFYVRNKLKPLTEWKALRIVYTDVSNQQRMPSAQLWIYYVVWSFALYNHLRSYMYIRASYPAGHAIISRSADWLNLLGICRLAWIPPNKRRETSQSRFLSYLPNSGINDVTGLYSKLLKLR